jgi:signal transduction histidine kinase
MNSDQGKELIEKGTWKSLRSKFFSSGIIVLSAIVVTLMFVLPFISIELEEQISHLREDLDSNVRDEAITIARLLVFEFSRLYDLVEILRIKDLDILEEALVPIRNYLWEKVTFNAVIKDILLLDKTGTILLEPFGTQDDGQNSVKHDLEISEYLQINNSEVVPGPSVVNVFMPLYIAGNRWGVVQISVSTEEIERQLNAQIARQDSFRQLILILFFSAIFLASLAGVLVLNFLARKITEPLKTLARNAALFARSGDANRLEEIDVEDDEVGLLARNFTKMAAEINRLLAEKDEAFAKLKASQEQLRQSEKLATLGQLSGGIAHEINNALSPIRLRSEEVLMTLEEGGSAEQQDLQVILKGIEQCSTIVQKLRDFAAPSLGERSMIDLNHVVRETIALVRRQIEKRKISIRLELNDIPIILANPGELEQVFMNMLLNSKDAIEAKDNQRGGEILITTSETEGSVAVTITDDGAGMDQATIDRMFEPFFTTKEVGSGTGLGMSVSFSILQSHGAEISVNSNPGDGTSIIVRFPLPPDDAGKN